MEIEIEREKNRENMFKKEQKEQSIGQIKLFGQKKQTKSWTYFLVSAMMSNGPENWSLGSQILTNKTTLIKKVVKWVTNHKTTESMQVKNQSA